MTWSLREAMLKLQYADLYPGLEPGIWMSAATLAEHLLGRILRFGEEFPTMCGRIVHSEHFEFRGGGPPVGARVGLDHLTLAG